MRAPDGGGSSPLMGLSARLLILTIFFVMLSEFLIYAPSIGRYRMVYMQERIAAAHLASLAVAAPLDEAVSRRLTSELLRHARSRRIKTQGMSRRSPSAAGRR